MLSYVEAIPMEVLQAGVPWTWETFPEYMRAIGQRLGVNVGTLAGHSPVRLYAMGEACSHLGGPLAEGRVEGEAIVCPWHGSRFALEDGRVLDGPATMPQPCFETRVREGYVEVRRAEGRIGRVAA